MRACLKHNLLKALCSNGFHLWASTGMHELNKAALKTFFHYRTVGIACKHCSWVNDQDHLHRPRKSCYAWIQSKSNSIGKWKKSSCWWKRLHSNILLPTRHLGLKCVNQMPLRLWTHSLIPKENDGLGSSFRFKETKASTRRETNYSITSFLHL